MRFPEWAVQYPWEWYTMSRILEAWRIADARRVLEIGIHNGGSMLGWMLLAPDAWFVGVDVDITQIKTDLIQGMKLDRLTTIQGNSSDPGIIEMVRQLGPYDFIFIDGDHSYEAVWKDFNSYRTMLAPMGIIAFHDISNMDDCGTYQFWQEIQRQMYHTITVSCTTKMGVGLILDGCAHE